MSNYDLFAEGAEGADAPKPNQANKKMASMPDTPQQRIEALRDTPEGTSKGTVFVCHP